MKYFLLRAALFFEEKACSGCRRIVCCCLANSLVDAYAYTQFGVGCLWCFSYPGLLLHTERECHSAAVEVCPCLLLYCVGDLNP